MYIFTSTRIRHRSERSESAVVIALCSLQLASYLPPWRHSFQLWKIPELYPHLADFCLHGHQQRSLPSLQEHDF
jgi:hypothetical protein